MVSTDLTRLMENTRHRIFAAADQHKCVSELLIVLRDIHRAAEEMLDQQDKYERSLIACHAGCDHCCVVNVSISFVEGIAITDFLNQVSQSDRLKMVERLDQLWSRIRGLDDEERLALRNRCAFLGDNGLCQIYPSRPLFCRSVTSTDPEACQTAVCCKLQGETSTILMNQYQQFLYEGLYSAVSDGLNQAGLDGRSFQMTGLVRYLLNHSGRSETVLRSGELSWQDLYA